MQKLNREWHNPDLGYHNPDCSAVINEEILALSYTRWPMENGIAIVPYTFNCIPYYLQPFEGAFNYYFNHKIFGLSDVHQDYKASIKNDIRNGLAAWEKSSNNQIRFVEEKNPGLKFNGLSFYFANTKILEESNMGAYTQQKLDNLGYLQSAAIVFPDSSTFWSVDKSSKQICYDRQTIVHEIGHAIGAEHLHQHPIIVNKLQHTLDGVYCSVMPYQRFVSTAMSECKSHCESHMAILPGPLDQRYCALVYTPEYTPKKIQYFEEWNLKNAMYENITYSFTTSTINELLLNLKNTNSAPLLSSTHVHLVSDVIMLMGMIYYQFPRSYLNAYTLSALMHYMPDKITAYFPKTLVHLMKNQLTSYAFSLGCAIYEGLELLPFIKTTFVGGAASFFGSMVGSITGKWTAESLNRCWQHQKQEVATQAEMRPSQIGFFSQVLKKQGNCDIQPKNSVVPLKI